MQDTALCSKYRIDTGLMEKMGMQNRSENGHNARVTLCTHLTLSMSIKTRDRYCVLILYRVIQHQDMTLNPISAWHWNQ
jgi:hypothetical protein